MQHLLSNPSLRAGRTAGVVVVVAAAAGRPSRYALRRKACHVSLGRGAPKCESPHANCLFQLGQYIETAGVFVAYHVQPFAAAYHAVCVPEHLIFCSIGSLTRCAAGCFDSHDSLSSSTVLLGLGTQATPHRYSANQLSTPMSYTCSSQVPLCQRPY